MSKLSPEKRIEVLARLQVNDGNVMRTARECGVNRSTVYRCMASMQPEQSDRGPQGTGGAAMAPLSSPSSDAGIGEGGPESRGSALIAIPTLPLQSYGDPGETARMWYAMELRTHQLLDMVLVDVAKRAGSWTIDDAVRLVKVAQMAYEIRTGKGASAGGSKSDSPGQTVVVVEFTDAAKPGEG